MPEDGMIDDHIDLGGPEAIRFTKALTDAGMVYGDAYCLCQHLVKPYVASWTKEEHAKVIAETEEKYGHLSEVNEFLSFVKRSKPHF